MVETRSSKRNGQPVPKKTWVDDDEEEEYEPSVPSKKRKLIENTIKLDIESDNDDDSEYEPSEDDDEYDDYEDEDEDEDY